MDTAAVLVYLEQGLTEPGWNVHPARMGKHSWENVSFSLVVGDEAGNEDYGQKVSVLGEQDG